MTKACFRFLSSVLKVSEFRCTTSPSSSAHGRSGGGGSLGLENVDFDVS